MLGFGLNIKFMDTVLTCTLKVKFTPFFFHYFTSSIASNQKNLENMEKVYIVEKDQSKLEKLLDTIKYTKTLRNT